MAETLVSDDLAHVGIVLLLDMGLVVLPVRPGAGLLDALLL